MEKDTKYKLEKNPYRSVSFLLVALGLFFIPFNSYVGIPFLGEFSSESCFLFFSLAFIVEFIRLMIIEKMVIPYKNPIFIFLILILGWFLSSFFLNFIDIQNYFIKQTPGNERFIRQFGALTISALIFTLTYYNIFSRFSITSLFINIRKIFLYSFIVVSIYTILEAAIIYFNFRFLESVLHLFDYFPFTESWLDYRNGRLSSVSYAPPVFGMYLMTISGWMFSYILTHKSFKSVLPTFFILVFVFLSGSRSALFVVIMQFLVFLFYLFKKKKYLKNLIKIGLLVLMLSIPFLTIKGKVFGEYIYDKVTSFDLDNGTHSISNKSRLGMIYTSGLVFLENPIKGVGFGQVAYEARSLYPSWATKNNWEFEQKYLNDDNKTFPPSYNIYTRLLAETGIIGFSLFTIFVIILIYICCKKTGVGNTNSVFYLVLLISFTGHALNWLQVDTFRVFGFWISLALLIILTKDQISLGKKHY